MTQFTSIFAAESLVTGGRRSQYRADSSLGADFEFFFGEDGDTGYCIDAPWVIPAGSTVIGGHHAQPTQSVIYRQHMAA